MTASAQNQADAGSATDQVARAARQELPSSCAVGAAQYANTVKPLTTHLEEGSAPDCGEGGTSLTPALLSVMMEVADFVSAAVAESLAAKRSGHLLRTAKKVLEKAHLIPRQAAAPLLSRDQLAQARRLAFKKAHELHLSEAEAKRLVDAVVGRPGA